MHRISIALLGACAAAAQPPARHDLLINGSGDDPSAARQGEDAGRPWCAATGWHAGPGAWCAQDGPWGNVAPRHGARFLRARATATCELSQEILLPSTPASRHLVLRCSVRSGDSDRGEALLELLDARGTAVASGTTGTVGSGEWREHRLLLAVPAAARAARVTLRAELRKGPTNDACFDDVALEPIGRGFPAELASTPARALLDGLGDAQTSDARRATLAACAGQASAEVIAFLTEALAAEKDAGRRAELLETLALTQSERAVPVLRAGLESSVAREREQALRLSALLPFDWRGHLVKLALASEDQAARKAFLARLAQDGDLPGRRALLAVWRATTQPARSLEILEALRGKHDPAELYADFLAPQLRRRADAALRHEAMRQLAAGRHRAYLQHLTDLWDDERAAFRRADWLRWAAALDSVAALQALETLTPGLGAVLEEPFLDAVARMSSAAAGTFVRERWLEAEQPLLRQAAARALAAAPRPGDLRDLARLAEDQAPAVALEAVTGLGRIRDPGVAPLLERVLERAAPRIAAAALQALWATRAPGEATLQRCVALVTEGNDWELRLTALDLLQGEQHAARARAAILAAFTDAARPVRIAAYQAATWLREPATVAALLERFSTEETSVQHFLADCLADLTGTHFGTDAEAWRQWWARTSPRFVCPPKPKQRRRSAAGVTVARYYDIPLRSDRLVFVIDLSGSMAAEVEGTTRLELAKRELIAVLEKLEPRARFTIIAFGSEPMAWEESLQPASAEAVAKAVKWVRRLPRGGGTNIFDSLDLALRIEGVEDVFLLTDGGPSAGRIIDMGEIRRVVRRDNALLRVRINTISIGGSDRERTFLDQLAEENWGICTRQ